MGVLTGCIVLALIVGGASDYADYERMPAAERAKLAPRLRHQLPRPQTAPADAVDLAPADAPTALPPDAAE